MFLEEHFCRAKSAPQLQRRCDSFASGCLTVWVIKAHKVQVCSSQQQQQKGVAFLLSETRQGALLLTLALCVKGVRMSLIKTHQGKQNKTFASLIPAMHHCTANKQRATLFVLVTIEKNRWHLRCFQ